MQLLKKNCLYFSGFEWKHFIIFRQKIFEIPPFFQTRPMDLGKKVHACSSRFSALKFDVCLVEKQLKKAQQRQKDCFDNGVETCQYVPGDLVFLFNPQVKTGEAAKFHGERKGPYEVLERTTEVNYRIKTPSDPGRRSKVIHFNNLKLYQYKTR